MKTWPLLLSSFLGLMSVTLTAQADEFPNRTVRIVATSPGGSALDTFARAIAEDLTKRWGTTVYVENKAGAGGQLAASTVLQSPADGYTLFFLNEQLLVANRFSYSKLSYDPDKSFAPISRLVQVDQLIVANAQVPFRDFAGLIDYAKKNPKGLNYGRWSLGSSPHLALETLNKDAGIQLVGIPYRGVSPVQMAMTANDVQLTVMSAPTGAALIESGKAFPLAVTSSTRSPQYPDVPTTDELGYPRVIAGTWYGLVGPAGMPANVVQKIERDVRAVLKDPTFFDRYPALRGWTVVASTPQEMVDTIKRQVPVIGEMMKTAGVAAK